MPCKDDDAGLLTQVKEEDAAGRKIVRKDESVFEWNDYISGSLPYYVEFCKKSIVVHRSFVITTGNCVEFSHYQDWG